MMNLDRKQQLVFLVLIIVIIAQAGFMLKTQLFPAKDDASDIVISSIREEDTGEKPAEKEDQKPKTIKVYVTGQVTKQGVVTLPEGSRWEDAVNAAQGLAPEADMKRINLAKKLTDGEAVYIPQIGELPSESPVAGGPAKGQEKINLNTATVEQLCELSGIGPTRAGKIVDFREKNGLFQKPEDLKKVSGIGDKIFDNLKDNIVVE